MAFGMGQHVADTLDPRTLLWDLSTLVQRGQTLQSSFPDVAGRGEAAGEDSQGFPERCLVALPSHLPQSWVHREPGSRLCFFGE